VKDPFVERESNQPVVERTDKVSTIDSLMASAVADIAQENEQDDMGQFSQCIDFNDSDDEDGLIQSGLFSDVSASSQDPEQDSALSSYCILEMPGGKTKDSHRGAPRVECFLDKEDTIFIIENHFSSPTSKIDLLHPPTDYPMATSTYILKELSVTWRLFGGQDFEPQPDDKVYSLHPSFGPTKSPQLIRRKRSDSSQLRDDQRKQMGGLSRDQTILMEIELNKIRVRHDSYPETSDKSFRLAALIGDIEIRDRLASSQLNKFLYCYSSETMPRQSHASMVTFKLLGLRSSSLAVGGEYCVHVGILPIKLNIDQV
jgi:autophagy-related protein 2